MRRLFTAAEAHAHGLSSAALRWGVQKGRWTRVERGVYVVGSDPATPIERAVALVLATGGIASGPLAGALLGLDSVVLRGQFVTVPSGGNGRRAEVRRLTVADDRVVAVDGVRCTNARQTLVDLASTVDDVTWEQMLESALRKNLITVENLTAVASNSHRRAAQRIRRVLALRPDGAPPTESLLETLMVQLAREVPGLGPPTRQLVVRADDGRFVARVDLAWPELGLFIELDGQQHLDQPVYDAARETAVVAATGWLCGRFTWTEVVRHRRHTVRRLGAVVEQARRRPMAS